MSKVRNKVRFTLWLKPEQECAFSHLGSSPDKSTSEAQHDETCSKRRIRIALQWKDQATINFMSFLNSIFVLYMFVIKSAECKGLHLMVVYLIKSWHSDTFSDLLDHGLVLRKFERSCEHTHVFHPTYHKPGTCQFFFSCKLIMIEVRMQKGATRISIT